MRPTTAGFLVGLLLVVLSLTACAGFDLGDVVQVKTPVEVQQEQGLPPRMSLNESEDAYQAWFDDTKRVGATWKANIEGGREVAGLLSQLTLNAWNDLGPTVAGLPLAGPASIGVTGLIGLFVGQWRLRKEKEASFNAGLDKGAKTAGTE